MNNPEESAPYTVITDSTNRWGQMDNQDENWERYQTEGLYRCPFFPNANLFSPKWVEAGWKDFLDYTDSMNPKSQI